MTTETELIAQNPVNRAISKLESGGDVTAKNPNSSASGKYEFTRATFEGVKRNNPGLPDISFEDFGKNADAQELYQQKLLEENVRALNHRGLEVNPTNQYLMHWAGAPKGSALIQANPEDPLGNYFKPDVLAKNRLDPAMSVGDFRKTIDAKMSKALLAKTGANVNSTQSVQPVQPNQPEIIGQQRLDQMRKDNNIVATNQSTVKPGDVAPGNTPAIELTNDHKAQLNQLDQSLKAVQSAPQTGEHNVVAASEIQKGVQDFGPRWGMAFAQALFGDKQGALNSITGGALSAPQLGEALVPNATGDGLRTQQVLINRNARGDIWYTDPATRQPINNIQQITSLSPEGSIGTALNKEQAKNNPNNLATSTYGRQFSSIENAEHTLQQQYVAERAGALPNENALINQITEYNKKFSKALDNGLKDGAVQAAIKTLGAIKNDAEFNTKAQEIATLLSLPKDQYGEFTNFLSRLKTINQRDKEVDYLKRAPNAGIKGEASIEGGARGLKEWLAEREGSHATQMLWNEIYKNNSKSKSLSEIRQDFLSSPEYQGIENYKKIYHSKNSGQKIDLPDGSPVTNFDSNTGKLILQRYNSKTGRVE
jgi:hypothetical protein